MNPNSFAKQDDPVQKTFGHAGVYTFGYVLRHSVSIIMLPIYTRFLTPEDYGIIELMLMTLDIAGILMANRIGEAIFRYYSAANSQRSKKAVISTAIYLAAILNGLAFIGLATTSGQLTLAIFGTIDYQTILVLFAITLVTQEVGIIPLIYFRVIQKPWWFVYANLITLTLQVAFNLYFVVYREMHVLGVVYSSLIVTSIMAVGLLLITVRQCGLAFDPIIARKIFRFSFPIIFATIGSFFVTFGDRFFLRSYFGLHEVGIYSLAYRFGFMFEIMVWNPFSNIWDSQRYEVAESPTGASDFQLIFILLTFFVTAVGLGMSVYAADLIRLMASEDFFAAAALIPLIVFAFIPLIWSNFCSFGILWSRQTKYLAYAEAITVITAAVGYWVLIPQYGATGAALATALAYGVRALATRHYSEKLRPMPLPLLRAVGILIVAICFYSISNFLWSPSLISFAYRTALFVAFVLLVTFSPLISKTERNVIIMIVPTVYKRLRSRSPS